MAWQWVKFSVKHPDEVSHGGPVDVKLAAAFGKAGDAGADAVRAVMSRIMRAAIERWPVDRHNPHSRDTFRLVETRRGAYVEFRIVNDADYSAFVFYRGLGKGPWPGPGKGIRLWQDYLQTEGEKARPEILQAIREAVINRIKGSL